MSHRPLTISCLLDISTPFKGVLFDAYGVFWGGSGLIPGSAAAMEKLILQGKIVGILSNSTQMPAKEKDKLSKHGLIEGKHFHFYTTSGEVAKTIFREQKLPFPTPQKKFWLFGGIHPRYASPLLLFQDSAYTETSHLHEADFIYISIPHINGEDQLDPATFHKEIGNLVATGLPMVCANPDRFAHEGNPPRQVVRQGSIAAIYQELGGTVYYIGKPSQVSYQAAMQEFARHGISHAEEVLMVGDTPETDIRGARQYGMSAALTIHTGIIADRIAHCNCETVLRSLPPEDSPNFYIKRFDSHDI